MLIKTALPLTNISGSIAGNVFQRDRFGLHITSPPRHVKTCNANRQITFNIFRTCCNAWQNHPWTPTELDRWVNYAMRHPRNNRIGEAFTMTARQAFFHLNLIRVRNLNDVTYTPPLD